MAEGGSQLLDLPEGCLIHALSFLSRKDLAAAAQSCRTFSNLALSSVIWLRRLREDLDLPLQVCCAHCSLAHRHEAVLTSSWPSFWYYRPHSRETGRQTTPAWSSPFAHSSPFAFWGLSPTVVLMTSTTSIGCVSPLLCGLCSCEGS